MDEQLLDFLVHECTPDQLLYALAVQASEYGDEAERLAAAANAYVLNESRYRGARPKKGEGLRVYADMFSVEMNRLRKAVALVRSSD